MRKPSHEEAARWLLQAQDEWRDADDLRQQGKHYLALFHFQQAAEKALKAYLYYNVSSINVFLTHSIDDLLTTAIQLDKDFETVRTSKKLDQYYIPTRYPNGLPGGVPSRFFNDPEESRQAMELARQVLELVEKKIESAES